MRTALRRILLSARRRFRSEKQARRARAERPCLTSLALITLALGAGGCVILRRPLVLPKPEQPYVAVLSGEMPEPISEISRHSWIIANPGAGSPLIRYELLGHAERSTGSDPFYYFGHGDVALHAVIEDGRETIGEKIACLDKETPIYNKERPSYFVFPGPNSNTFVDQALRRCSIHVDLPSTAIGKDYRGVIGVSLTSGGTGVQFETFVGGVKIGLKEGVELHILGVSLGVDFWPPALIVPINPGRLGFDDR